MTLPLWGGIECTVNRVGNQFFDQLQRTGHNGREADIELIHSLGIRTLRYPLLWERIAPHGLAKADWGWADARMQQLRDLAIEPIVGLVHHGSGPRYTSLVDPAFPEKLADFALLVAKRYPWVRMYTPVNEPLTTARFAGLYGHWYPHGRSDRIFARLVLNQVKAINAAMRAIRSVTPEAELVQTEDIGRIHSTPGLEYQADFENERRWLTFDALCGKLRTNSPMGKFLRSAGISNRELAGLQDEATPIGIIGMNYYLTSERFLDHRCECYPSHTIGGNGVDTYADVEALRVADAKWWGAEKIIGETWSRYKLPIAITEVHSNATREQQLRWFTEVWQAANSARDDGVDVRAVTAWSLFGASGWHNLVTTAEGDYESGVFDVRGPEPRATALAGMIRSLIERGFFDHPVLSRPGWWRDEERLLYHHPSPVPRPQVPASPATMSAIRANTSQPLLIIGGRGTLGRAFARICSQRRLDHVIVSRSELDITDRSSVCRAIEALKPWAVVNAAGFVRVDDAEHSPEQCYRDNCLGAETLARELGQRQIPFMTFSSDLVFDGESARPYIESDTVSPLCVYGHSKAAAENVVRQVMPAALIIRSSAFFSPWDQHNFLAHMFEARNSEQQFHAPLDEIVSPTYVPDLVHTALDLLLDASCGIWHLANAGSVSWLEFARRAADAAGYNNQFIVGCYGNQLARAAKRPRYSVLGSERGIILPNLDNAIERYCSARAA